MGVGSVFRHVDDQAGRLLVVQQAVDGIPQFEKAAVIASDCRAWKFNLSDGINIGLLRVVPDHKLVVLDLLGDQLEQILGDDGLAHSMAHHSRVIPYWSKIASPLTSGMHSTID